MDIGRAFAYINEDEEWWKKLLLGAIFGAIPLVNFVMFGYQIQIARNVADNAERPLPDWQDFGKYFLNGLRFVGALMVLTSPLLFAILALSVAMIFLVDPSGAAFNGSAAPPPEFFLLYGLMFACTMPYTFLIYGLWPLLSLQLARESKFSACFRFSEMWALIKQQPMNYVLIVVLLFGLYMAATFLMMPAVLLLIIPCLGFIAYMLFSGAAMMLVLMVIGHLQGQFISLASLASDGELGSDDMGPAETL